MITGNGSAEIGLSYSLVSCDGVVFEAGLGLDLSGDGYVSILGHGSAELGLTILHGTSIVGQVSAGLRLDCSGAGVVGILGQGMASIALSVVPELYITITGEGEAAIGLDAWISGIVRAALSAAFQPGVVNLKTRGTALYTNFPLNSLFKFQGSYYGCTDQGIVRLSGKKDNGADIAAIVRYGISDCGGQSLKRFPSASVTCRNEGLMELAVIVDETKEIVYEVSNREGRQGIHVKRVPLAKGVRGHSVQLELRNVQGADFDLQVTELDVEHLARR